MTILSLLRHLIYPSLNWVKYGENRASEWYRHIDAPLNVMREDYKFPLIRRVLASGQFQIIKNSKVVDAYQTLSDAAKAAAKL